jgi:hypothetical protein
MQCRGPNVQVGFRIDGDRRHLKDIERFGSKSRGDPAAPDRDR